MRGNPPIGRETGRLFPASVQDDPSRMPRPRRARPRRGSPLSPCGRLRSRNQPRHRLVVRALQRRQPGPPAHRGGSMSRRTSSQLRTVAVLATATVTGLALAAPGIAAPAPASPGAAAAPADSFDSVDTYTGLKFVVPAGSKDLGQPQTCTIDADLYKPHSASPSARVPAILTTNGFGGSKADQAGLGEAFAQRGYAVLS